MVVAEGVLQPNGVFKVAALGLPPAEPRADSIKALQVGSMLQARSTAFYMGLESCYPIGAPRSDLCLGACSAPCHAHRGALWPALAPALDACPPTLPAT